MGRREEMAFWILAPLYLTLSVAIFEQLLAINLGGSWEIIAQESCRNPLGFSVFEWRERFGGRGVLRCAHIGDSCLG